MIEVLLLHFWQIILIESSLHMLQNRLWIFVKNFSMCEAFSKSRVGPPLSPIGNSVWTGGFICLGAAFSGLPILTPTDVEYFGLIFIPEVSDIILVTDLESSILIGFLNIELMIRRSLKVVKFLLIL